jgi:hypothetical protein
MRRDDRYSFMTGTHKLGFISRPQSVCIAQDGDFCPYKIKKNRPPQG